MSNFTFLKTEWPELYETAREAEQNVNSAPRTSCFYARRSLERAVKWLYASDTYLKQPYADNLAALIHEPTFRENLEPCLFPKILTIQKIGNLAVHSDKPISSSDSLHTLKELFHVLYWLARSYTPSTTNIGKPLFDITHIPQKDSAVADRNAEQLAKLQAEQSDKDARLTAKDAELARTIEEIAALKAKIQEYKERNSQTPDDHDYSEAETRDYFIDLLLKESGWDLKAPDVLEYPVTGMPNDKGEGFVDYVLWGDDGLPLAVVEAKRTRKDSRIGQQQAKLYADCLEIMKGQRPIIFFTNGYETWLWDDLNYPHLKGKFCRVIDNYETYAQTLIEDFSQKDNDPIIAISVDMLDTGIDVPEIVNLVFFKLVRSKTKFHQMMGRGTRLCKGLFGPGLDKENFYVFDYCQNFEFFAENPEGIEGASQESLSKKIFKQRLNLLLLLQQPDIPTGDGLQRLRGNIEDTLHGEVTLMNSDNFIVRPHRRHLDKYTVREQWGRLNAEDALEVTLHLAGLPAELPQEDETAKRFDLLMLNLQLALLEKSGSFSRNRDKVMEIAARLEGKGTIPMVAQQMVLILDLQTESWWAGITLPLLEEVRHHLRELIKFLDKGEAKIIYTDFEDTIGEQSEIFVAGYASAEEMRQYRLKVERFIRDNANHITINKLRMNRQITKTDLEELERLLFTAEEVGNRERFEKVFGHQQSLGALIRKLVGLDRGAASEAFGEFLHNTTYSATQIRFIDQVVSYLTQNGTMDPGLLYEPPFTDIHNEGLDGVFGDAGVTKIIHLLQDIELRAAA